MTVLTYEQFRKLYKAQRHWQKFTHDQRADMASSHRLGHRQREATGEYFYTHELCPDVAFDTAQQATRRAYEVYLSMLPAAWIPVGERLPDSDRNVLVVDHNDEVWFGWYGKPSDAPRRKREWSYFDGTPAKVSHWMDLPQTPGGRKLQRAGLYSEKGQF